MASNDSGSGGGGAMGTPDLSGDVPSADQEENAVVSGGGLVGSDEDGPSEAAK